jgi:hypothetical protein
MKKTFLFIAAITFFKISYSQQIDTSGITPYLQKNMEVIDLKNLNLIKLIDKIELANSIFLFGENHGSANPQLVDVLLFKQLYKQAGVRHYIAEVDAAKAWMLNNYLKDGNEAWLQKVFKSWIADTAQWANKSNYAKFQQLRTFYISLAAKQKFTILGIDVFQDYGLLKEYSKSFVKSRHNIATHIYIDSLQKISDTIQYANRKQLGDYARRLLAIIKRNEMTDSGGFYFNAELKHFLTSLSFIGAGMYRDSIMFRNFESIVTTQQLQNKKSYGFLGFYHCLQTSYEKSMPFAALVKQYSLPFKGRILSIQMMALQSKTLLPYMGQLKQMMPKTYVDKLRNETVGFENATKYVPYTLSNDDAMMKIKGIDFLKNVTVENTTTIFKVNGAASPFSKTNLLAEVSGFQTLRLTNAANNTTQAFQYIILFRNSAAGLPIE